MVGRLSIFCVLLIGAKGSDAESLRTHIIRHEGYSHHAYDDRGHLAIGVGHRLLPSERRIKYLTGAQIDRLFERDLAIAERGALASVPSLRSQPQSIQNIVIALNLNLGVNGFRQMTNFRRALDLRAYDWAADELRKSKWAKQLPYRADEYARTIRSFSRRQFVLP